jgi:hypothetical protein
MIARAAAAGGGDVIIPAGTYNVATALVQNTSGVHLIGQGIGAVRDTISPGNFLAPTRLVWTGAAGATMLTVTPSSTSVPSLYSADVRNILFDCASLANVCVEIAQVSGSQFYFAASNPRMIGIWFTVTTTVDAPGNQGNDIWISSRSTDPAWSPTGILLDGNNQWNTSYNRFWSVGAWYYKGDGVVFANSDNNVIVNLNATANSGATGTGVVFAAPGYTMPNGLTTDTHGPAYTNQVLHTGTFVDVQGFGANSVWTANGGNTGTAALAPVTISTNGTTASGGTTLHFSSTTGIASGMSVNCGGISTGVANGVQVVSTTGTTVIINYPVFTGITNGQSCTFSYGFDFQAVPGTYTITATGATTYNITAPAGGTNRTNISVSGGVLNGFELIVPMSGSASIGDSFTVTANTPASNNSFLFIDEANATPVPFFNTGATGTYQQSYNSYPVSGGNNGVNIGYGITPCGGSAPSASATAINIGNCGGSATGTSSLAIGGIGNSAYGFGSITIGGHNVQAGGSYSVATNEFAVSTGADSFAGGYQTLAAGSTGFVMGRQATDRARYSTRCFGTNEFDAQGDAQVCDTVLSGSGTSASSFQLTGDRAAAGSANVWNITANGLSYSGDVRIVCRDVTSALTTNNSVSALWRNVSLYRLTGAASTVLSISSASTPDDIKTNGSGSSVTFNLTADTTNAGLSEVITVPASDTWRCSSYISGLELGTQ